MSLLPASPSAALPCCARPPVAALRLSALVAASAAVRTTCDVPPRTPQSRRRSRRRQRRRRPTTKDRKDDDEPKPSVTHHTVTIDGQEINYTATAGKMLMKTDEGEPKAHVFFVAYTKSTKPRTTIADDEDDEDGDDDDDDDEETTTSEAAASNPRPITFCFNGGPGSSSVWLHLGMLGPVRVKLDSDAKHAPAAARADPQSLLAARRHRPRVHRPREHRLQPPGEGRGQEASSTATTRTSAASASSSTTTRRSTRRWASPKFLLGESYGGIRAAGLSGELRDRYHLELNGIVLISAVVDFQTLMAGGNNDIAYALFLPVVRRDGLVPQGARRRPAGRVARRRGRSRPRSSPPAPTCERSPPATRSREDRRRRVIVAAWPSSPACARTTSTPPTCASACRASARSCSAIAGASSAASTAATWASTATTLGEFAEHDPSADAVFGTFTSALNDYLRTHAQGRRDRGSTKSSPATSSRGTTASSPTATSTPPKRSAQAMTQNPYLQRLRRVRLLRPRHAAVRDEVHARPPGPGRPRCATTSRWASTKAAT